MPTSPLPPSECSDWQSAVPPSSTSCSHMRFVLARTPWFVPTTSSPPPLPPLPSDCSRPNCSGPFSAHFDCLPSHLPFRVLSRDWPIRLCTVCPLLRNFVLISSPAFQGVWCHWAPPLERSKLATTAFTGFLPSFPFCPPSPTYVLLLPPPFFSSYAGAVFGLPLSAWLVSYVHWSMPFYIYGIAGVLWSLFWFSMTFEKPAFHPTISVQEKQYIESQLGPVSHTHPTVPSPSLLLPSFRSARQSFNPVPIRSVPHHSLACHPHLQTRLGHHRGQLCSQLELLPAPPEPAHLHARRVGPAHLRCACLPFPALTVPSLPTFPLEWSHCRPSPCRHGPLPLTPLPSPLTFQLLQGLCCAYRRQIGRLFALQQNPLDHCRPEAVQLRGSLPSPPSLLFPFPFKDSVARHFSCWWWPTQRVRGQRCSVSCGQGLDPTYCCQMGCPNSWNSIAFHSFGLDCPLHFRNLGKCILVPSLSAMIVAVGCRCAPPPP